jgi:hypothetical protein
VKAALSIAAGVVMLSSLCATPNNEDWSQRAFIQRVTPAEFGALEKSGDLDLSRSSDLVLILGDDEKPYLSYALRRSQGQYQLVQLGASRSESDSPEGIETSVLIPHEIGEQVKQAFQFLLEQNVYPPSSGKQSHEPKERSNWWISLRVGESRAIAGVALGHAMHINDRASVFWSILGGFRGLIRERANGEELNLIITELDRSTARFVGLQKLEQEQRQAKRRE